MPNVYANWLACASDDDVMAEFGQGGFEAGAQRANQGGVAAAETGPEGIMDGSIEGVFDGVGGYVSETV